MTTTLKYQVWTPAPNGYAVNFEPLGYHIVDSETGHDLDQHVAVGEVVEVEVGESVSYHMKTPQGWRLGERYDGQGRTAFAQK